MRPKYTTVQTKSSRNPFLIVLGVGFILVVANVWLAGQLSHLGFRLGEIESQIQQTQTVNERLQRQKYQISSTQDIHQKALSFGFERQVNYLTLTAGELMAQSDTSQAKQP